MSGYASGSSFVQLCAAWRQFSNVSLRVLRTSTQSPIQPRKQISMNWRTDFRAWNCARGDSSIDTSPHFLDLPCLFCGGSSPKLLHQAGPVRLISNAGDGSSDSGRWSTCLSILPELMNDLVSESRSLQHRYQSR
jgi:hypothetical protein